MAEKVKATVKKTVAAKEVKPVEAKVEAKAFEAPKAAAAPKAEPAKKAEAPKKVAAPKKAPAKKAT